MSLLFLKIKIKSLADEAKIIRGHERKQLKSARWLRARDNDIGGSAEVAEQAFAYGVYSQLHEHRTYNVREECRAALLAYGFLRGRDLDQLEKGSHNAPLWATVRRLVHKHLGDARIPNVVLNDEEEADARLKSWIENSSYPKKLRPAGYFWGMPHYAAPNTGR